MKERTHRVFATAMDAADATGHKYIDASCMGNAPESLKY
jgi:hypothetical protein